MKKIMLNIALFAFIGIATISCKNNNEAETTQAQEVAEAAPVAVEYTVDTEASQIHWKGSKPVKSHNGTISLASGMVMVMGDAVEAGKFTIDMNTITDLDLEGDMKTNLENHLKGTVEGKEGDFFNVTAYPFSTFQITEVATVEGKTMVSGNLTIKDKTHNISFPATISMEGNVLKLTSETFTIDRTQWGVNFGSKTVFDNLGEKFISDDIELTVNLVANKS
ncbi:MAG: lipid-binding protein [Flavobacteriaceae bacterium]|mgnify:FL=1|nr:lipid-binding protein [Flavobacteriaceae bacterium]|tara:strand:+ start:45381 stop:46046 length:666 start_codon:yes stop_codon:yes gene_type:complete